MALVGYPLESGFIGYDDSGEPIFDRAVGSRFYRAFWSKYFTDGIFFSPADNFLVRPEGGFRVRVNLGECHIRGVTAAPDDEIAEILTLDPPEPSVDRTDRIVLRADFEEERLVSVRVRRDWREGDELTRNSNMWELALADVLIKKDAHEIQTTDITDLRLDTELCGIVTEPVTRTNTQHFFEQMSAEFERVQSEWETQKSVQQQTWQEQMNAHDAAQEALYNDVNGWYTDIKLNISKLQTFDFDNAAMLTGCTARTVLPPETEEQGQITETVTVTSTGKLVATRVTTFSDGAANELVTVYDEDGETVLSQVSRNTSFGDAEIVEIIT